MGRNMEAIFTRHSTRSFEPGYIIPLETQMAILEAGTNAPSPKNRQPWRFIILDQKESIQKSADVLEERVNVLKAERIGQNLDISDLNMALLTADIIRAASLLVFICYDRDEANEHGEKMGWSVAAQAFEVADILSIGACVENMLLMAESLGIDSLWICDVLYAEHEFEEHFMSINPILSAVAFGKEHKRRTMRLGVDRIARWITKADDKA